MLQYLWQLSFFIMASAGDDKAISVPQPNDPKLGGKRKVIFRVDTYCIIFQKQS